MNARPSDLSDDASARNTLARVLPNSIFLIVVHAWAVLWAVILPADPWAIGSALLAYAAGMFSSSAGYHRYFSHRSFQTSRWFAFLLGWAAESTLQRGVLWWAAVHRHHHRHSDEPADLHSPVCHGFVHSHIGWVISPEANRIDLGPVADLMRRPELVWLDRYYLIPGIAFPVAVGLFGLTVGGLHGCLWALTWAWAVPLVLLYHGSFTINSVNHVWGNRVYDTPDDSRNNAVLALVSFGEGWHNNHHHYPTSCRQGFLWWQFDITFYVLTLLSWVGLVWDLKAPPARVLAERGQIGATRPPPDEPSS